MARKMWPSPLDGPEKTGPGEKVFIAFIIVMQGWGVVSTIKMVVSAIIS